MRYLMTATISVAADTPAEARLKANALCQAAESMAMGDCVLDDTPPQLADEED